MLKACPQSRQAAALRSGSHSTGRLLVGIKLARPADIVDVERGVALASSAAPVRIAGRVDARGVSRSSGSGESGRSVRP
jgi:hypothetical protein